MLTYQFQEHDQALSCPYNLSQGCPSQRNGAPGSSLLAPFSLLEEWEG